MSALLALERILSNCDHEPVKLENPYVLRLSGDPDAFLHAAASKSGLWHLLERLFSGEEIAEAELATWGLKVSLDDEFIAIERGDAPQG